jgi:hypothetical protein
MALTKQAGVAILYISDKIDFKPRLVTRDKEGHFVLIKGAVHQEEITIINLFSPPIYLHSTSTNMYYRM